MLKLYILKPKQGNAYAWEPEYDKSVGFVVRAENEEHARQLANDAGGDETGPPRYLGYRTGGDPWLDPEQATCEELTADGPAEVILRDHRDA